MPLPVRMGVMSLSARTCSVVYVPRLITVRGADIVLSGENNDDAVNLAACTGECDSDAQCVEGLKCFQRDNSEPIPGCTGAGGGQGWDYCHASALAHEGCNQKLEVRSTGLDAKFLLDNVELSVPTSRGLNVVTFTKARTGKLALVESKTFDTYRDASAARALATHIAAIAAQIVVAVAFWVNK